MKSTLLSLPALGPMANFKARKAPFGLSLSKPFDKLGANGGWEATVVNSRNGPRAEACFVRRGPREARWSN
jgi:hypothetical protein